MIEIARLSHNDLLLLPGLLLFNSFHLSIIGDMLGICNEDGRGESDV